MKKITLIAAAAMVASVASAATPVVSQVDRSVESMRPAQALSMEAQRASRFGIVRNAAFVDRTADGDLTEVTPEVLYVPTANAFYSGLFTDTRQYNYQQGFTGIRNEVGFRNLTQGASEYDWQYGRVTGLTEDKMDYTYDYTNSSDTNLFMGLNPFARYSFPTLAATFGDEIYNSAAAVNQLYHCGRSPYYWGWSNVAEDAEYITYDDLLGVGPAAYKLTGATLYGEFMIEREGSSNYAQGGWNANGVYENWEAYSEPGVYELSNLNIDAFGYYIPEMPSPYQMNATWFWFQSQVKEGATSAPLTINVYAIDENGEVDYDHLLGTGEFTIPEGQYQPVNTGNMPVIELAGVDEDGYAIDAPVCVEAGTPVFVRIDGLDNTDIISFQMVMNKGAVSPVEMDRTVRNYLYPTHAYAVISADVKDYETDPSNPVESKETFMLRSPYNYYGDNTRTTLVSPVDYCMYFDINFPVVINYTEGSDDYETANFNVSMPAEETTVTVPVGCSYKIDVLIEEGLAQVNCNNWLSVNQEYSEEEGVTNVTIKAEANDGADRTGYVVYRGYGIDFWIVVNQAGNGEGSINSVEAISANGAEYFDLQGRRLPAAPATGIYMMRTNGTTAKYIAK